MQSGRQQCGGLIKPQRASGSWFNRLSPTGSNPALVIRFVNAAVEGGRLPPPTVMLEAVKLRPPVRIRRMGHDTVHQFWEGDGTVDVRRSYAAGAQSKRLPLAEISTLEVQILPFPPLCMGCFPLTRGLSRARPGAKLRPRIRVSGDSFPRTRRRKIAAAVAGLTVSIGVVGKRFRNPARVPGDTAWRAVEFGSNPALRLFNLTGGVQTFHAKQAASTAMPE
jgi:hypothetical protein